MAKGKTFAERFMSFAVTGPDCWGWRGAKERSGYGVFFAGAGVVPRKMGAHRAAWLVFVGPIPTGKYVLHRCDNPECTNPQHLFIGTAQDNTLDMHAKGRAAAVQRALTAAQFGEAKRMLGDGATLNAVARHLGCDRKSIKLWAREDPSCAPMLERITQRRAQHRLTAEQADTARRLRAEGDTLKAIAERFGCTLQTIWRIVNFKHKTKPIAP